MELRTPRSRRGLVAVAGLMVLFGLAEVLTGFNVGWFARQFEIPQRPIFTIVGVAIGALYVVCGVLVLSMRRPAAALAIVLLGVVFAGRISLVLTGAYPVESFLPAVSLAIGTSIVVVFAIYVAWLWNLFGGSPV